MTTDDDSIKNPPSGEDAFDRFVRSHVAAPSPAAGGHEQRFLAAIATRKRRRRDQRLAGLGLCGLLLAIASALIDSPQPVTGTGLSEAESIVVKAFQSVHEPVETTNYEAWMP